MDVLIVDDDAGIRNAYAKILERAGYMVTAVDHGLAAIAELNQRSYRTIVCDIRMPFLEGKSFYHELEENHPTMAKRLIFVTSWIHDENIRQFLEESGHPYFEKPVSAAKLVGAVREMARQSRLENP